MQNSTIEERLPTTQRFEFADSPECVDMEFRMVYQGPLPSDQGGSGRTKYKHLIRKQFHRQLRELWKQQPALRDQQESLYWRGITPSNMVSEPGPNMPYVNKIPLSTLRLLEEQGHDARRAIPAGAKSWVDHIADDYERLGTRFVPLVSKKGGFSCALDILFLRRDAPGNIVVHGTDGGDVDNRLKTLFDALKIPVRKEDLGGIQIDRDDENPFFCLLSDDGLITSLTVTTDRLLAPRGEGEKGTDVHLVIRVTISDESSIFRGGRLV